MYFNIKLKWIPTDIVCISGGTSNILSELTEVPDTIIGDGSSDGYEYDIERVGGFDNEPV